MSRTTNPLRDALGADHPLLNTLTQQLHNKGIQVRVVRNEPPFLEVARGDTTIQIPIRTGYLDILGTPTPYEHAAEAIDATLPNRG